MSNVELAEALFDAFAARDDARVRALCTADFQARQNGGAPMDLDTVLAFSSAVHSVLTDFRYEDAVRSATASGFVEEHAVRGTLPDGSALDVSICVVADVRDGKVHDLREYFDGVAAAGLVSALS